MNRVVLLVVLVLALGAVGTLFLLRSGRAPAPAANRTAEAPAPVRTEPPRATAPTPPPAEPARTAAPRRPRADTPAPAAPVEPAAPAAPTTATLRISSDVPGAQVFLNREFVGATPATAADLKPGQYQLNVSAPGFDNHVESLTLDVGERDVVINFKEVRLNASLEVIHKHRMGSCKGKLVATPQGIRYETSDKDDAFSVALSDVDTFQVDYLNKNLRLQIRKGKRFDFTDPEGNADRLFVFHRDVDKARERLKAAR